MRVVDSVQYAYKPELGAVENPYYYHVNEVLFEAHLQRVQRLSRFMWWGWWDFIVYSQDFYHS